MAVTHLLVTVATSDFVAFAILGVALAILGGAMVTNISGFGEWLVEHVIPRALRMGEVDADRKKFGWGYLLVGLLVALLCFGHL